MDQSANRGRAAHVLAHGDTRAMRRRLLHVSDEPFVTDGGMETTLVFEAGFDLPHFSAFVLLDSKEGVDALLAYYELYVRLARERRVGLLLDTPTWRASSEWGSRLGYDDAALADVNRRAVALLERVRAGAGSEPEIVISGCVGPRRDAYRADDAMSEREAEEYHSPQLAALAETSADLVSALT